MALLCRTVLVPVSAGNISALEATKDYLFYMQHPTLVFMGKTTMKDRSCTFLTSKIAIKTSLEGITGWTISANGEKGFGAHWR